MLLKEWLSYAVMVYLLEAQVPAVNTASEAFDVGGEAGSQVALDYYDHAAFEFNGTIEAIAITYIN